jgi:inner membrane protein
MPFNTLLWRVVAMTPTGYVEAERSVLVDEGRMHFRGYPSNVQVLEQARGIPAVDRLSWFNRGFMRAQVLEDRLVLSDLRMGLEPNYNFQFEVATRKDGQWQPVPPLQRPWSLPVSGGAGMRQLLGAMWRRTWDPAAGPVAGRLAGGAAPETGTGSP